MKFNILFHAINGIGYGHIQRSMNIIGELLGGKNVGDIHLASSCDNFQGNDRVMYHKLTSSISHMSLYKYNELTYNELLSIIIDHTIDVMFHDTFFVANVVVRVRHIDHYLVYRLTDINHFRNIKPFLKYFKKIFIPHSEEEFFKTIPQELCEDVRDLIVFVGYITPSGIFYQEILKKKKTIVISPGMGGDKKNVVDFFVYLESLLSEADLYSSYEIYVYPGLHYEEITKMRIFCGDVIYKEFSKEYKDTYNNADIFIGRGGYNTVLECLYSGKPSLLFGSEKKFESQYNRIDFFSNGKKKSNIFVSGKNLQDDVKKIQDVINIDENPDFCDIFGGEDTISKFLISEISKQQIMFFQNYHLEKTQNFVIEELLELSKVYNINIFTFFCEDNFLTQNNLKVYHSNEFEELFKKRGHQAVSGYSDNHKSQLKYFLSEVSSIIKRKNIKIIYCPFLWDAVKIMHILQVQPEVRIYGCGRGNDVYNVIPQYPKNELKNIFASLSGIFVRDLSMQGYIELLGCGSGKTHIIRSGKKVEDYTFTTEKKQGIHIMIGGRIVEKKGILETLKFLEVLLKLGYRDIKKIYFVGLPKCPKNYTWTSFDPYEYITQVQTFLISARNTINSEELHSYQYGLSVMKYILHSQLLHNNIEFKGFMEGKKYREFLSKDVNTYIGHFKVSENGDTDGIPNIIVENMLSGNLVFSTIVGGLGDILIDEKTGYVFSGDIVQDIKKFISACKDSKINQEYVAKFISEEFEISKQVSKIHTIFKGQ